MTPCETNSCPVKFEVLLPNSDQASVLLGEFRLSRSPAPVASAPPEESAPEIFPLLPESVISCVPEAVAVFVSALGRLNPAAPPANARLADSLIGTLTVCKLLELLVRPLVKVMPLPPSVNTPAPALKVIPPAI